MSRVFITATNTDIGKTFATKLLIQTYSALGYRVGVIKPLETGVVDVPLDGTELLQEVQKYNEPFNTLSVDDIVPYQFELPAAPLIANKEKIKISFEYIEQQIQKLEVLCDVMIIEGAGGLYVPIDEERYMIDLIKYLDAKTLLVTHANLGCINDTLLSLSALEQADISHTFAINIHNNLKNFKTTSKQYFDEKYTPYFLLSQDIEAVAKELLKE